MKRGLVYLYVLALGLCSCRSDVFSTLEDVESYIQERPDSALVVLESINRTSLLTEKSRAKFSLLYTMALDKNYIDTTDIGVIAPAVEYYSNHGSPDEKLKALYYEGRIYSNAGDDCKAVVSFTDALHNLALPDVDDRYCGLLCRDLAAIYLSNYNYEDALTYFGKAREFFIHCGLTFHELETLYSIALTEFSLGKISETKRDLAEILSETDNARLSARAKAVQAYIDVIVGTYDLDETISLFSSALATLGTFPQISHRGAYAYVLAKKGYSAASDSVFASILNSDSSQSQRVYHYWKTRIAEDNSDLKTALDLYKILFNEQNDVLTSAMRQSAARAQRDYFDQESRIQADKASRRERLVLWVVLIAISLIALIYAILKSRINLQNERIAGLTELTETAKRRIDETDKNLAWIRSEYMRIHKERFELIGQLCETYYRYSSSTTQSRHIFEKVKEIINIVSGDARSQMEFEEIINNNLDGLMAKFRTDFPNYDESDYRFICCLFVGFDATMIMTIFNMPSQGSVYVKKSRIKKVIQNSESENKDLFLSML